MAQPAEALSRYDLATDGDDVREQFANRIYDISPDETPVVSSIGRGNMKNTYKSWLLDKLADPDANNAAIDGDDFAGDPIGTTKRVGNFAQILRKDIVITDRVQAVDKAARRSELARQTMRKGLETRRDLETIVTGGQAAREGDDTTPGLFAGMGAWYTSNAKRNTGGASAPLSNGQSGFPNAAATDAATTRPLSETLVLDAVQDAWKLGGMPTKCIVGGQMKRRISNYLFTTDARIATQYQDQQKKLSAASVIGSVDYWLTDFGTLEVIPDRFSRERDVHIIDPEYWSVDYLRSYQVKRMGKTGDNEKRVMLMDATLCSKQEAASAIVADCNEAVAVVA